MILDTLDSTDRYVCLQPGFKRAFDFLRRPDLADLPPGHQAIDGDALFAIVARDPGRSRAAAPLEVHNRYLDIQFVIDGADEMGWRPRAACRKPRTAFDADKDVQLFDDTPDAWVTVTPGTFVIFFPEDAHAPLVSAGTIHKVVVKVAL